MRDAIGVFVVILAVAALAYSMVSKEKEVEQKKFQECMADIHNVYVCDTYSRQHYHE